MEQQQSRQLASHDRPWLVSSPSRLVTLAQEQDKANSGRGGAAAAPLGILKSASLPEEVVNVAGGSGAGRNGKREAPQRRASTSSSPSFAVVDVIIEGEQFADGSPEDGATCEIQAWEVSMVVMVVWCGGGEVIVMHSRSLSARGGGGGYSIFMHGRRRMTIFPPIRTMPGRSMSGFHRPGRHCFACTKREAP